MRLLVLGSAVSGRSVARLATRRGHSVTVYDEAPIDPVGLFELGAGIVSGAWDHGLLDGVDLVVASPGFSERSLPVTESLEYGTPIWSEIEFAWRCLDDVAVVAVTGTNGKTTVTTLTAAMLAESGMDARAVGNIGLPLSDVVDEALDVVVVEVSSFQLRFIERFRPRAAAIVNVAADHLDWHGSEAGYRSAKARIFERQEPDDFLVFDIDDEGAAALARSATSRLHPVSAFGLPPGGSGVTATTVHIGSMTMNVDELGTTDPSYIVDILCAGALALEMGAFPEAVRSVAAGFDTGSHRRQLVAVRDDVSFVDDSKATNLHAAMAAIAAYPSVILIAGGLAKGVDISSLAVHAHVRGVVGIGEAGPEVAAAAGAAGRVAATMDDAVRIAADLAESGDTVLLAPGAASFDQFESYAARGDAFATAIARLKEGDQ